MSDYQKVRTISIDGIPVSIYFGFERNNWHLVYIADFRNSADNTDLINKHIIVNHNERFIDVEQLSMKTVIDEWTSGAPEKLAVHLATSNSIV